jgi:hypothetical protein
MGRFATCPRHEMPTNEPEPENYSIDDMMDRLRSRGEGGREGEAELVTRKDGTQAYRVRKRKRRSHQPKKELESRQRRIRVIRVVTGVALVALAGLAVLGSVIYLNSSAYQESIATRIRIWTGAEPQLSQFRVSPVSAGASSVELTWPESSMLQSLKVNGVRADLRVSSIFGGAWKGSEMLASQGGTLVLRRPTGAATAPSPERSGVCPFQFRYRSPQFSVVMGNPEQPAAAVRDSEVSLAVLDPAATTANLQFEGGTLNIRGWGDFGLNFASLQVEPGGIRVGTVRLAPVAGAKGEIEILNPRQATLDLDGGETEMGLRIDRVPLSSLMGPVFGTWLAATVETPDGDHDGTFRFKAGETPSVSCRIPFHATATSESKAGSLPLFGILANEMKEPWYQAPVFDLAFSGIVVRDIGSAAVENLKMQALGRLTVTGSVSADAAGNLEGSLQIGLPEAALDEATAPFRQIFKRRDSGNAWASVRVSGTSRQPLDDLQKQIEAAMVTTPAATGGADSYEDDFRDLTTPKER